MSNKFPTESYSNQGIALNVLRAQLGRYVTGNIFYVKKTDDADYDDFVNAHWDDTVYSTVATGVAATTASIGDYVGICMGTYTEAQTIANADVTLRGLGSTRYSTVIDGDGSIAITITGVDVKLENLHIVTAGAAVACVYGTGLVGAPTIKECHITNLTLTSIACVNIAGTTSRGLWVERCSFMGGSSNADAVNDAGEAGMCLNCASDALETTESTCFGTDCQAGNSAE